MSLGDGYWTAFEKRNEEAGRVRPARGTHCLQDVLIGGAGMYVFATGIPDPTLEYRCGGSELFASCWAMGRRIPMASAAGGWLGSANRTGDAIVCPLAVTIKQVSLGGTR